MQDFCDYLSEVKQALQNHQPVFALESTLIIHALPFPHNKVAKIMAGKSLQANIHLIKNNVKLGAELAQTIYSL